MIGTATEIKTVFCDEYSVWDGRVSKIINLGKVINEELEKLGGAEIISITHRVDGVQAREIRTALIVYKEEKK